MKLEYLFTKDFEFKLSIYNLLLWFLKVQDFIRFISLNHVDHVVLDTLLFMKRSVLLIQLPKYECGEGVTVIPLSHLVLIHKSREDRE